METGASATGANQPPKTGGEEDLSMEEILQSIRKIIADDDGDKKKPAADEDVPGSDVLELTDAIEETPAPAATPEPKAPPTDVLSQIDAALVATPPANSLLSDKAAAAAAASFKKIHDMEQELPPLNLTPSPHFHSGNSVEDMVAEMLRPMMKEWLDANLPAIVERIVEREIRKLTQ